MSVMTTEVPLLSSEVLAQFEEIRFGFSLRDRGESLQRYGMNLSFNVGEDRRAVERNRQLFFGALGIPLDRVASPGQCHSAKVVRVDRSGTYEACDALVSDQRVLFLAITVADCVPMFLFDPRRKAVAAVHAGWRGSSQKIAENSVQVMKKEFGSNASDLIAFIGPSAGACCYQVGQEVIDAVKGLFVVKKDGSSFFDLKAANYSQLLSAGVTENNIEVSSYCTICNPRLFHSYRREHDQSGRMMGVIGLT